MIKYKYKYTGAQTNTNTNHNLQEVVLPQGKAVGEMLSSRDGLPYSAFRSLLILIVNFFIIITRRSCLQINCHLSNQQSYQSHHHRHHHHHRNHYIYVPCQVAPVCIAAGWGFTVVKTPPSSYSWMAGNKKCQVS